MKKIWNDLKVPKFMNPRKNKVNRKEVHWLLPVRLKWKLNFDGAAKGNPRRVGVGCIIRDSSGKLCVWVASKNLGVCSNNNAELEVLCFGLQLCIQNGIDLVEIEGDSQLCVQAIILGDSPNWRIGNWIGSIKELLGRLNNFSLGHVYRGANKAVEFLANWGVSQNDRILVDSSIAS